MRHFLVYYTQLKITKCEYTCLPGYLCLLQWLQSKECSLFNSFVLPYYLELMLVANNNHGHYKFSLKCTICSSCHDLFRYGYLTNTKVKFILVTTDLDVRDADVRNVSLILPWFSSLYFILIIEVGKHCPFSICPLPFFFSSVLDQEKKNSILHGWKKSQNSLPTFFLTAQDFHFISWSIL